MRFAALSIGLALSGLAAAHADVHQVPNPRGPLAGKTVVLSPGHGYQLRNGVWVWQRPLLHDIREGIHTNEIMMEAARHLAAAGARVELCRERGYQTAEVIVQNGDPGYAETGSWSASAFDPARLGPDYRVSPVSAQETATASFTPDLPLAGRYPVYVWFAQGTNRSSDALYRVHHAGGVSEVRLTQQVMGNHWAFLGEWAFHAGTQGKVVLSNQGSDPTRFVIADGVRFGGGVGASGQPRWREGAKAYINYRGFPSTLGGVTIRPAYAEWLAGWTGGAYDDDFRFVALHTNAGGGTGTSNFSFGNGRNGIGPAGRHPLALQMASDRLRDLVQEELVQAFRADFDPAWRNRGGLLANFGQLRENQGMPSCMIELAFHDHPQDAAHLRNPRFRSAAARAIYKGVLRSFDPSLAVAPLPPRALRLQNLGNGELRVSWEGVADPLEPSAAPQAYRVYLSPNGWAFDDGVDVQGTSTVLSGLAPGAPIYVRVSATNAGGEGQPGPVGGALVGDPYARVLLVDGFTRAYRFTHDNWLGRYTYDYAREHLAALGAALPSHVAVDFAAHDAVGGAGVALDDYTFVDWLLGRESSADRTFDATEQQAVSAYLAAGGTLLVSGTEVAWDLGNRGGGAAFLDAQLGATYAADDGGVFVARPTAGGPFAALGTLDFSNGRYAPLTPDVLGLGAGAEALLAYETAGAPVAGVGVAKRVVTLGFPLESVGDLGQRTALVQATLDYLDPDLTARPAAPPPPSGGGGTAPVTSSTAPGSTAAPTSGGRSSSGGCALVAGSSAATGSGLALLAVLLALLGFTPRTRTAP